MFFSYRSNHTAYGTMESKKLSKYERDLRKETKYLVRHHGPCKTAEIFSDRKKNLHEEQISYFTKAAEEKVRNGESDCSERFCIMSHRFKADEYEQRIQALKNTYPEFFQQ